MRPPPRSTLFPHTALSRSPRLLNDPPVLWSYGLSIGAVKPGTPVPWSAQGLDSLGLVCGVGLELLANGNVRVDRKSTRLNSSYANISYAVFCLKKKKSNPPKEWREFCERIKNGQQDITHFCCSATNLPLCGD